jgi:hypothetical protein
VSRRGRTRRELLGAGVTGAAGLLALPAVAGADTPTSAGTTSAAEPPVSETDRLQRLTPFLGHEEAHVAALTARLKARGGSAPAGPDSMKTANRYLAHRGIGGRLGQLKGERDALYLLLTLEQVTIGAYFVALTKVNDAQLITLVCQIMGNEAQHDAMIGLSLPKATPGTAVPYGLVQGLQ